MLLLGAVSVSGMAVAFPVGMGTALIMGVFWSFAMTRESSPAPLFGGATVVLVAIVIDVLAFRAYIGAKPLNAKAKKIGSRGVILSIVAD